ncbi:polysaccharide biosynthesis protein [Catenibacterium mitsuokai]|uniref:polysaccharide biosynthesis protein n=1 Tax=Catenibacterium mitsuokai TaxID=100886 RepID=UPI001C394BF6|nr:nucleoside-diphosphate sugar epimerase/dehydratase [Catenibacterium mitsuokai]MBV3378287.1 polysaccharide biosynthesis protein [Catenibacterium mitsuokai]
MSKGSKRKFEHWQVVRLLLVVYDFAAVIVSFGIALWLRFDCKVTSVEPQYLTTYTKTIIIYALFCLVVFWFLRLYKSIWRFASYSELLRVILATVVTGVIYTGSLLIFNLHMPVSYYVIGITVQFIATLGIRFFYRFVLLLRGRTNNEVQKKNVMIIGAGSAGQMLFRDIKHAKETNETVACFIDDNPNKWDRYIDDVPVFGSRDHILEAVDKFNIEKIYVAVPSANPQDKRDILRVCNETSCELMNLPGMYQLYTGEVSVSKMKKVQIEDLLGRDPIKPNMDEVFAYVRNKVVLITGVGSIGSELARQIASHNPKQLILFDVYENNAYDIQLELRKKYQNLDLVTLIGSVRDSRKMFDLFKKYRPQIVYHAAAHKHVPLMEDSPCESIKNNAMGTYKTAYAAMVHGCEKFVLISTDKAVNPTNIMGASKRLCEMIIQAFAAKIKEGKAYEIPQLFTHERDMIEKPEIKEALKTTQTEFVAVRFGNVLGSNGSVIPIFKRQIEAGGPVTVTHPDIIRYFMTIPEAVSLVLLAGTYAHGGEIFVLDMGEPVKITTLARNLIRLSGYTPDVDIKLEFTGLRPGEKLYEEKLMAEEGLKKTKNDLIHIGCPIPFDINEFLGELDGLLDAAYRNEDDMKERVQKIVSTYHPA